MTWEGSGSIRSALVRPLHPARQRSNPADRHRPAVLTLLRPAACQPINRPSDTGNHLMYKLGDKRDWYPK